MHLPNVLSQTLLRGNKLDKSELDFLLRFPIVMNVVSPVDFLSHVSWGGIKALSNMEQFRNLDRDIEVRKINVVVICLSRKIRTYVSYYIAMSFSKLWRFSGLKSYYLLRS